MSGPNLYAFQHSEQRRPGQTFNFKTEPPTYQLCRHRAVCLGLSRVRESRPKASNQLQYQQDCWWYSDRQPSLRFFCPSAFKVGFMTLPQMYKAENRNYNRLDVGVCVCTRTGWCQRLDRDNAMMRGSLDHIHRAGLAIQSCKDFGEPLIDESLAQVRT